MVVFSNVPDNLDLDDEAEEDSNAGPQNVVIKSVLGLECLNTTALLDSP